MKKPKSEKWYAAMKNKKGGNQYTKAKELGLPKPELSEETRKKIGDANKSRCISDETRKKISEARIKFLRENPDKVPYKLNHYSKGRSYAEDYWKTVLDSNDMEYIEQYQFDSYTLDFAFPDKKIDLEIDGDQHYLDERIVASDKRRNAYLSEHGWKTIRVKWSDFQKLTNKKEFIDSILKEITNWLP